MDKKQYNNIIDYTLKHEVSAQTDDSLVTARAVFNNMGIPLPQGDLQAVYEIIKTDNYMGWHSCSLQEAQEAANNGIASIGISEDRIVVISATDEEEPVTETASVMVLSENASTYVVDDLQYYSYSRGSTTSGGRPHPHSDMFFMVRKRNVDVGWTGYNALYGTETATIRWTSSNESVASVNKYSGYITAKKAGIVTITAKCTADDCEGASFELWVKGKTPVFLIHGRTSNSFSTWGAGNKIFANPQNPKEQDNNHFNSAIDALSIGDHVQASYISNSTQNILGYQTNLTIKVDDNDINNFFVPGVFNGQFKDGEYSTVHPEGGNLAYKLKENGYKENVNLFVFNYPNEDAVVHNAKKFEKYIENLIDYVRTSGTDEMKACFYDSRDSFSMRQHKINLVGHSMGGLVSRYYIENLGQDNHVDKLITICTPHWGSGYADASCITGAIHKLCDHDLRFESKMYGGSFDEDLNCNAFGLNCYNGSYKLTPELKYSKPRNTRYYAIAGIDYDATPIDSNNYVFEMPVNLNTYQQVIDYMTGKSVYKSTLINSVDPIDVKNVGDNMVGFLSQIGWTENDGESPQKQIQMEKIFVDVDANAGNGDGVPGLEALNMLHGKIQHRTCVMSKVYNYLTE